MGNPNPQVDGYLRKSSQWQPELTRLRAILLACGLNEEIKWRQPCYTYDDHNIVIMGRFKECCMLNFVKGALLKDEKQILVKTGENTQAARVIRFTSVEQIDKVQKALKSFVQQAIAVEKAGLKVPLKKITEHPVPSELQTELDQHPALKAAFHSLTPGRRRAYFLFISAAKQSKTREQRVQKCIPRILDGKGLMD